MPSGTRFTGWVEGTKYKEQRALTRENRSEGHRRETKVAVPRRSSLSALGWWPQPEQQGPGLSGPRRPRCPGRAAPQFLRSSPRVTRLLVGPAGALLETRGRAAPRCDFDLGLDNPLRRPASFPPAGHPPSPAPVRSARGRPELRGAAARKTRSAEQLPARRALTLPLARSRLAPALGMRGARLAVAASRRQLQTSRQRRARRSRQGARPPIIYPLLDCFSLFPIAVETYELDLVFTFERCYPLVKLQKTNGNSGCCV
ncbi:uncharacterized protein LOC110349421 isoform X2 [Heterocephalus glaber]|uniref:Uncharacterized protein LOC110349421 isoform X2 n=1 Tax=Heterocephalus glaber TaxID=10181 RepID=A0AAX6T2Q5_HETGA|nr:uncharacterized protein LOC110349421 isoform X2 [Heterocephalus glaber]